MNNVVREHSLKKLLRYAQANKLGAMTDKMRCMYHTPDRSRFCAIGCLLTPEEHTRVDQRLLNTISAETLFLEIPGLAARLGFTSAEAKDIQQAHDVLYSPLIYDPRGPLKFIAGLDRCLAEGRISYAAFNTEK